MPLVGSAGETGEDVRTTEMLKLAAQAEVDRNGRAAKKNGATVIERQKFLADTEGRRALSEMAQLFEAQCTGCSLCGDARATGLYAESHPGSHFWLCARCWRDRTARTHATRERASA